jgi:hypothetical protein
MLCISLAVLMPPAAVEPTRSNCSAAASAESCTFVSTSVVLEAA